MFLTHKRKQHQKRRRKKQTNKQTQTHQKHTYYIKLSGCIYDSPFSQQCYNGVVDGPKKDRLMFWVLVFTGLSPLTTDTSGQLDVLGHDCHTFGVDGTQVGILEQSDEVSFASFLEGHHG